MNDDIVTRLSKSACISCYECTCGMCALLAEAVNEIERLRRIILELRPFLDHEIKSGLSIGPPPKMHPDDQCADCLWFEESQLLAKRVAAGDFDI